MIHQANRNQQIGNICIQWAALEYQLAVAIWALAGLEAELGKVLTASLDVKARAVMAHTLAHETNAPRYLKIAIKKVLDAVRKDLLTRRNQAVHGIHFAGERPDMAMIEMHRGKGGRGRRPQSDRELYQLGQEINALSRSFAKSLKHYVSDLAGSLEAMARYMAATTAESEASAQAQ